MIAKKRGRKKIEFSPEDREKMVFLYDRTSCSLNHIAARFKVSPAVVTRVIDEERLRAASR